MAEIAYVLVLDTETSGLNPATDRCIEVAVTLYDVRLASPLLSYSSVIYAPSNAVAHVNGIPEALLRLAPKPEEVWPAIEALVEQADAILAHNATFDMGFVPEPIRSAKPWICTMNDVDWPRGKKGSNLTALMLAHGLGVVHAHRASSDVDMLSRLLSRTAEMGVELEPLLVKALRPKKKFVAKVSYDDRNKAKEHGFTWDGVSKQWSRLMPPEDVESLPFKVIEARV